MERFVGSLLLEPRSLLVVQEDAYVSYLHDIQETLQDILCPQRLLNFPLTSLGQNWPLLWRSLTDLQRVVSFDNEETTQNNSDEVSKNKVELLSNCTPETLNTIMLQNYKNGHYDKEINYAQLNPSNSTEVNSENKSENIRVCQSLEDVKKMLKLKDGASVAAFVLDGKNYILLERTTRISLTIRNVPKVIKTKIFLGKR